jgi:hypothetical protein
MGVAPNKATASLGEAKEGAEKSANQVTGFVLQARAAEDREHNRVVPNSAHDKLVNTKNQAFRAKIPPRTTQGREYRKRDPKWTDKVYKLDTAAGQSGFEGGQALTKLPATKYRDAQLMGFKATKVQVVPKESKNSNFTDLAVFKDISKYEDAREALRPWAIYVVRYFETQPGETGRIRAIDRDLKLHKAPKEIMAEFLPKTRLPLALYEMFPEFFDVESDDKLKKTDTRGEGHAVTLLAQRPAIVGESVAPWNPDTETLGDAVKVEKEPAAAPPAGDLSPRRPGENMRAFNLRMAVAMGFDSVAAMWEKMPEQKAAQRREQQAEAAERRVKAVPRPPGLPKP